MSGFLNTWSDKLSAVRDPQSAIFRGIDLYDLHDLHDFFDLRSSLPD